MRVSNDRGGVRRGRNGCVRLSRAAWIKRLVQVIAIIAGMAIAGFAPIIGTNAATIANPPQLKMMVEHLQKHYQATQSFSAKFVETITRVGAPPQERQGTVYYRKPGRIRFDFTSPQPETLVSDGTTFYDYDPGLNQVMETPLGNVLKTRSAAAFLMGAGNLEREFDTAPGLPSEDNLQTIRLTPKGGGHRIELGMDPANFNIVTLQLNDALGNVTLFRFDDIRINVPLEESLFAFKVPAGADIVSPSGTQ
jgi:outer membrane lipoprotein carrier protein